MKRVLMDLKGVETADEILEKRPHLAVDYLNLRSRNIQDILPEEFEVIWAVLRVVENASPEDRKGTALKKWAHSILIRRTLEISQEIDQGDSSARSDFAQILAADWRLRDINFETENNSTASPSSPVVSTKSDVFQWQALAVSALRFVLTCPRSFQIAELLRTSEIQAWRDIAIREKPTLEQVSELLLGQVSVSVLKLPGYAFSAYMVAELGHLNSTRPVFDDLIENIRRGEFAQASVDMFKMSSKQDRRILGLFLPLYHEVASRLASHILENPDNLLYNRVPVQLIQQMAILGAAYEPEEDDRQSIRRILSAMEFARRNSADFEDMGRDARLLTWWTFGNRDRKELIRNATEQMEYNFFVEKRYNLFTRSSLIVQNTVDQMPPGEFRP